MNIIKIKLLILLCFFVSSNLVLSYSQKDFKTKRRKNLCPIQIDTLNEPILIIEKSSAFVFFKQSDILKYLQQNPNTFLQYIFEHKKEKIYFRDFWWDFNYTKEEKENYYKGDFEKKRNNELFFANFYEVGASLIFQGDFMVIDKKSNEVISKKLKMKKIKYTLGQVDVHFKLPSGDLFWYFHLMSGK